MKNCQLYRVTFLLPGETVPADVTVLKPDMRSAYEWAHEIMPDAASITIEAPRQCTRL